MTSFDIMLPFYGNVRLMQDAVRSVLAQDHPDFRLTVIDDGDAAEVPEWFAGITGADSRVRYLRNAQNIGITRNFQKCVDLSEADHVVIMGCDDLMKPDYLSTVRAILADLPDVGMIQPGVEVIDETGTVRSGLADRAKHLLYSPATPGRTVMGGEALAAGLLRGNWLYFPSVCWRGEALRAVNFRSEYSVIQDLALVIDLLERGEELVVDTAGPVFQYRRHSVSESSLQAFSGTRFTEAARYFAAVADRMDARGWPKAARAARIHSASRLHALTMIPGAVRQGNRDGARVLARHAFTPM